jgi:hypothetical protein
MKIISSLIIFCCIIIFSCTDQGEKKSKNNPTLDQAQKITLTKDYSRFLMQLDSADASTIPTAASKYKDIFNAESDVLKDSGFVLFYTYYEKVENNLNEIMSKDTTNFDALIFTDDNNKPLPLSKKLMAYKENIEKNGFMISSTEGMAYIEKNGDYTAKEFYTLVSSKMKTYLEQLNKEKKEGFQEDAGLTIEPKIFIDRIIWWENFVDSNEQFILIKKATENKKLLLTFLITGMDNTQVLTSENGEIEKYYKTAYTYLQTNFANSKSNKLVAPYFAALLKKDKSKTAQIINEYKKQHQIINFNSAE